MSTMTVKKKLYLSYGAMVLIALAIFVISIVVLGQMKTAVHEITTVNDAKLFNSGTINTLATDELYMANAAMLRVAENDTEVARGYMDDFVKDSELLHSAMDDYKAMMTAEEERSDYRTLSEALNGITPQMKEFEALIRQNKIDAAWPLYTGSLIKPLNQIHDAAQKMSLYQQQVTTSVGADASKEVLVANWILCLMLVPIVIAGVIVLLLIRKLDAQLRKSIGDLTDGSEQVASAATQVSSSSQMLAKDTSEQAAMIEETSASSEEINSMARRNAEHSKTAAEQMAELKQLMESGTREMETATQAMDDISQSSDKISRIIQVIEKIAFQTNILALNAAVEAARAGEAGKGFAVVADEVRNLAQQCAQAAQDTGVLIEHSQQTSKAGHLRVQKVAEETRKMSLVLDSMKDLVDEINGGSQEQGRGIEQIGRAITQMEQGTQKSAANAEESAAAAEQLTAQSNILRDVAEQLGVMVGRDEGERSQREPAGKMNGARQINYGSSGSKSFRTAYSPKKQYPITRAASMAPESAGGFASERQFPLEEAQFTEF
jgi:methyl-accepting chemotaxis protein/methyl-accepting chemotaxis protein-1 (serine sensor receptor)